MDEYNSKSSNSSRMGVNPNDLEFTSKLSVVLNAVGVNGWKWVSFVNLEYDFD